MMRPATGQMPEIVIEPDSGWTQLKLRELWEHRELLYFLAWREVKVRYKQTAMGAMWALLQPLLTMLLFTLLFRRLGLPSGDVPYPLFTLAGVVPWTFFANGLTQSSNSLVNSANLIKKVYFPRLTIPTAPVVAGLVDFGIAFLLLLLMMLYYGVAPSATVIWFPAFLLLAICTSLGVGLWMSALNVEYRDVRYVIPFLTQFWMLATPIFYSSSRVPEEWRLVYGLNPMVGVVEGFRWALLGSGPVPRLMMGISIATSLVLLLGGAYYFRRMEKTFADIV
ncbi:MAG TPA: ABC transporter permease [Anaerolineales bacterium]|nr:ABC transporter permease [Anaerolineales bacterium]